MQSQSIRLIVAVLLTVLLLSPGPGYAQTTPATFDPAAAAAEEAARRAGLASPALTLADFAGAWGRHGYHLTIGADGEGSAVWRIYAWCGEPGVRPPCDSFRGNQIVPGGRLTFRLETIDGQVAYGVMRDRPERVALRLEPDGTATLVSGTAVMLPPTEWRSPRNSTILCRISDEAWNTSVCGA